MAHTRTQERLIQHVVSGSRLTTRERMEFLNELRDAFVKVNSIESLEKRIAELEQARQK